MKLLILDNYDSFTYNLAHYFEALDCDVTVIRNNAISVENADEFSHIVISPGPGLPHQAGITKKLIEKYIFEKPFLGICLGYQALAEYFGGALYNQNEVAHGIQRKVLRTEINSWLLKDLPEEFLVGLYHSWAANLPVNCPLKPVAIRANNVVMAAEHGSLAVAGVQFHPESIMTPHGKTIIKNWLNRSLSALEG